MHVLAEETLLSTNVHSRNPVVDRQDAPFNPHALHTLRWHDNCSVGLTRRISSGLN